jgi:glycosyltransferase involved in cell wall biosynthesis
LFEALILPVNILFVSHAANRSGAPLVLLELLRYLRRETSHRATVLCLRDGPLLEEFGRVAELFGPSSPLVRASLLGAAQRRLHSFGNQPALRLDPVLEALERLNFRHARGKTRGLERNFDLVYLNSVASGDILPGLEPILRTAPLICHVHEMKWAIDKLKTAFDLVKTRADGFIAASDATKTHLEGRGIAAAGIEVVHEFVDFAALETDRERARIELRGKLRLPGGAFLVGGCGTMEWRKGADWWVQLAALVPGAHFVWLGGQRNEFSRQIEFDLAHLKVQKRVHFLPATVAPAPFFAGLDVFALTSREDPFPLVGIEAAAQGVPILCFQGAGGMSELVQRDAGFVAPYGDLAAMAREIARWQFDEAMRLELGRVAAVRARQMCDVGVGAARIVARLERAVGRGARASREA